MTCAFDPEIYGNKLNYSYLRLEIHLPTICQWKQRNSLIVSNVEAAKAALLFLCKSLVYSVPRVVRDGRFELPTPTVSV